MTLVLIVLGSAVFAGLFRYLVRPQVGDALLAGLIFGPAVLYWVEDKDLTALGGFGFTATFADAAGQSVGATFGESVEGVVIQSLAAGDPEFALSAWFEACTDYFVLRPGHVAGLDAAGLDRHMVNSTVAIGSSLACGRLAGVIVLDDEGHYLGTYDAGFFAEALALWVAERAETDIAAMADWIEQRTIFGAALKFPDKRIVPGEGYRAAINEAATLVDAFGAFGAMPGDILVVTDEFGGFRGLLRRGAVERALLGAAVQSLADAG